MDPTLVGGAALGIAIFALIEFHEEVIDAIVDGDDELTDYP